MTTIAAYTQYQCNRCGQIHIKAEYGSISIFVPVDIAFKSTDLKICARCGESQQVQEYINMGRISKSVEIDTYLEQPTWWQKIRRRWNDRYGVKDVYVTDLYPRI